MPELTRRDLLKIALVGLGAIRATPAAGYENGRLSARPHDASGGLPTEEPVRLELEETRDGYFYVPERGRGRTAPLILALHGASGSGQRMLRHFIDDADRTGSIVIAPDSRDYTWDNDDVVDIAFIDRAMSRLFDRYKIDRRHIAVAGYSDGASYALTLGLTNGDLFTHVIAFSAGFLRVQDPSDVRPRIFLSHGTGDEILPIDRSGRIIAASLRRHQYSLQYREFKGGHIVPPDIMSAAFAWFLM